MSKAFRFFQLFWRIFNFSFAKITASILVTWGTAVTLQAQAMPSSLGTTNILVGPMEGSNTVVISITPSTAKWTATTSATWLHLTLANSSGTGSTNVLFSYDANLGATRTGIVTINGQTLIVTQAGSTYIAAQPLIPLVPFPGVAPRGEVNTASGVAVDSGGNVYTLDLVSENGIAYPPAVEEWMVTNNAVFELGTIMSSDLQNLTVDSATNIYFADAGDNAILEAIPAEQKLITLVSSGLNHPLGIAVDSVGNVFIADTGNNAIKKFTASSSNLTTLVSSGLNSPENVAIDVAGNLYIADTSNNVVKEWTAETGNVTVLVPGLSLPTSVAVDGEGNLYIVDTGDNKIEKWIAATGNLVVLESITGSDSFLGGVAVDNSGNVYLANLGGLVGELPNAYLDPTTKLETGAAGTDALPVVLPSTENLLPPFNPISDQAWLTVTGITNETVSFSFSSNTNSSRTAHITLLGQIIPIIQGVIGTPPTLLDVQTLSNGAFQFSFTNNPNASFTIVATTNLFLPLNEWPIVGVPSTTAPGVFQFTSQPTNNSRQMFYNVRSP